MADPNAFAKLVPGFDFLQGLMKNASAAMPNMSQWIAPTLDPKELDKRIEELRTVQFWLEQNARMLGATIQALEVQRMTLSTLRTMNVSIGSLSEALKARMPQPGDDNAASDEPPATAPAPEPPPARAAEAPTAAEQTADDPGAASDAPPAVDPMQWWSALTRQFTELAANAMKDTAADAAKNLAGAMAKQTFTGAGEVLKKAAAMPKAAGAKVASRGRSASASGKPAAKPPSKASAKGAGKTAAAKGRAAAKTKP